MYQQDCVIFNFRCELQTYSPNFDSNLIKYAVLFALNKSILLIKMCILLLLKSNDEL